MNDLAGRLKGITLFLLDVEGTLCRGDTVFPFTAELLREIRRQGKDYRLLVNATAQTPSDYVRRFAEQGVATEEKDYITAGQVTAQYLRENQPDTEVYLCGSPCFREELRRHGVPVTAEPSAAGVLVIGGDAALDYASITDALQLMQNTRLPFILTHSAVRGGEEYGSLPDCGEMAELLTAATGKEPIVIGKPSPLMPELAMQQTGIPRENTAIIGDTLACDIQSGKLAEMTTVLVFSGEETPESLRYSTILPDVTAADGGAVLDALRQLEQ